MDEAGVRAAIELNRVVFSADSGTRVAVNQLIAALRAATEPLEERVKALELMFDALPADKVSAKMSLLQAIRQEVGDDKITHEHLHQHTIQGVNAPPRAENYEQWLQQNEQMQAVEGQFTVESPVDPPLLLEEDVDE